MNRENAESLRDIVRNVREGRLASMPSLPLPAALLLSLYIGVCMAYLPMWHSPAFAGTVLFLTAAMAALTLRSPWLIGMMTVPAVLIVSATGSLAAAALPVALLCGIAYGAFLLLNVRSPLTAAVPLAAFAVSVLTTGDAGQAMLSLVGLPATLTLAYSLRRGLPRVRAICRVAIALAVPLVLLAVLCTLLHKGLGSFADLSATVAAARRALAEHLASWETGTGENAGRVVLEGMEFALASALFNILPGAILAALAIFSYLTDLICLTLFRTYERAKYLSGRVFILAVSLPAAVIFLTVYLLVLILGEGDGMGAQFAAVVAENLYLTLLPAMILAGMLSCIRTFLLSSHRGMLLVAAILLVVISPGAAVTVLSLLGAFSVVWGVLRRRFHRPGSK